MDSIGQRYGMLNRWTALDSVTTPTKSLGPYDSRYRRVVKPPFHIAGGGAALGVPGRGQRPHSARVQTPQKLILVFFWYKFINFWRENVFQAFPGRSQRPHSARVPPLLRPLLKTVGPHVVQTTTS